MITQVAKEKVSMMNYSRHEKEVVMLLFFFFCFFFNCDLYLSKTRNNVGQDLILSIRN